MKRGFPFVLLCLFLCLMPGCSAAPNGTEQLTVEAVRELAKKGEELAWSDLEPYPYEDVGSGLVIRLYPVDSSCSLMVGGGSPEQKPLYIRLVSNQNSEQYIDIRTGDIDAFLKE